MLIAVCRMKLIKLLQKAISLILLRLKRVNHWSIFKSVDYNSVSSKGVGSLHICFSGTREMGVDGLTLRFRRLSYTKDFDSPHHSADWS